MALPKMPIWTELVCRHCATTGCGQFIDGQRDRTKLRKQALAEGWLFAHDDVFCCKHCLSGHERDLEEQRG
jgi:hypothetical protein